MAPVLATARYLIEKTLSVVLAFVGTKMLLADVVHVPTVLSLGIVAAILVATLLVGRRAARDQAPVPAPPSPTTRRSSHVPS